MSLKVEMESEFPGPFFICSNIKVSIYKVFGLLSAGINSGYLWDHVVVCVHFWWTQERNKSTTGTQE